MALSVKSAKRELSSPVFDGKILRGAVHKVVLTGGTLVYVSLHSMVCVLLT